MLTTIIMSWCGLFWLPPLPEAVEVYFYQRLFVRVVGTAGYDPGMDSPQVRIHVGRVVDTDGNPIGKASVKLCGVKETGYNQFLYNIQNLAETETDEEGKFRFEEKGWAWQELDEKLVLARKEGFSLGWAELYEIGESAEEAMVLTETSELAGKVVNEEGLAISGARVHVLLFSRVEWRDERKFMRMLASSDWLTATTDGSGGFSILHIPAHYTAEFVVQHEEYFEKMTWDALEYPDKGKYEAGARDLLITMSRGGVIRVKVADEQTGIGIPKVRVTAIKNNTDFSLSGITDSEGMAGLPCLPGEYRVVLGPWVYGDPQLRADAVGATVAAKGTTEVTLKAYAPSVLEVQVRDVSSGEPVPGIYISVKPVGGRQEWGERSNENGLARIDFLPPGKYQLVNNQGRNYQFVRRLEEIILEKGGIQSVEVEVEVFTSIQGMVTDLSGTGLSDVEVFFIPGDCPVFKTDGAGRYEIPLEVFEGARETRMKLHTKPYLVFHDSVRNLGAVVEFPVNKRKEINVKLTDGYAIQGRVVDQKGTPLAGAELYLNLTIPDMMMQPERPAVILQQTRTDLSGFYMLKGLARDQRYVMEAYAGDRYGENKLHIINYTPEPGYNPDSFPPMSRQRGILQVDPNEELVTAEDIVLAEAGLTTSGTLYSQSGKRVKKASITIKGEGQGQFEPALTSEKGEFIIKGLVQGKIEMNVAVPDSENVIGEAYIITEAGVQDMVIVLGDSRNLKSDAVPVEGGLVEILVRGAEDKEPVEGVTIEFEQSPKVHICRLLHTDEAGVAQIVLPKGSYRIKGVDKWEDYETTDVNQVFNVSDGQKYNLVVEMERKPEYSGMVVDKQGVPVGGARLQLLPETSAMTENNFNVITEADGRFSFSWNAKEAFQEAKLFETSVFLVVSQERRNLAATFELTEPSFHDWKITLEEAPSIGGAITDSDGRPIVAARINYEIDAPRSNCLFEYEEIRSNEKGEYLIPALPLLPAGYEFRLNFSNSGHGSTGIPEVVIDAEELKMGEVFILDVSVPNGK